MDLIVIIDYGMGNLRSVEKALEKASRQVMVSHNQGDVRAADAIVLPGVGAFGDAMVRLKRLGLDAAIKEEVTAGKPFLGICLGLALLFEESDEHGVHEGLGLLPGRVELLPTNLKIPHIGWNRVSVQKESRLFDGVPNGSFFYFVHSYAVVPKIDSDVLCRTEYGCEFASGVERDNIAAVQFHPEKSSSLGLRMLENFVS